jgi:intein-encoded DNA endonuclease-like protein
MSTNIGELNLYIKQSTELEIVANIQDIQMAKLRSNNHILIAYEFAGSVKMWPTVTRGRLTRLANFTGFTAQIQH